MKITVLTLFPDMVGCFLNESIVKRAQEKKLVAVEIVNIRDFAEDSYGTVDDRPYGGGAGMVLMAKPIVSAIKITKSQFPISKQITKSKSSNRKQKVVLTSPRGEVYIQKKAQEYSKLDHLILIAGHYEGVDERVLKYVDEEVSLGDFVMTGGEIAAAAIVDSMVRLLPGVLKKDEAVEQESFFTVSLDQLLDVVGKHPVLMNLKKKGIKNITLLEYPHYTRPEEFSKMKAPEVLLSGNHAEIEKWRLQQSFELTLKKRRDLLERKTIF